VPADVDHVVGALNGCPLTFQEYVDKAYELRITVVGQAVLACKIDSQNAAGLTAVDWRQYNIPKTPHYSYEVSVDLRDKLLLFHQITGLRYSAFDLIRSTAGEYIFLETNPFGQWLWIEDLTGMPITLSIANELANPSVP
jgi:glutathione synthase/RimK-type ligase-like ATP-grasp enzyme